MRWVDVLTVLILPFLDAFAACILNAFAGLSVSSLKFLQEALVATEPLVEQVVRVGDVLGSMGLLLHDIFEYTLFLSGVVTRLGVETEVEQVGQVVHIGDGVVLSGAGISDCFTLMGSKVDLALGFLFIELVV